MTRLCFVEGWLEVEVTVDGGVLSAGNAGDRAGLRLHIEKAQGGQASAWLELPAGWRCPVGNGPVTIRALRADAGEPFVPTREPLPEGQPLDWTLDDVLSRLGGRHALVLTACRTSQN